MRKTKLALVVAATLFSSASIYATETSSGVRGKIVDANGNPQANLTIELVHVPTKTVKTLTTSDGGVFRARGLAVGGPYRVRLQDGSEFTVKNAEDLFLKLSNTATVNLVIEPKAKKEIETISVTGSALAAAMKQGAGSEFGADQIANTGSIGRDLKSVLARDSKIIVDNTIEDGPGLSVAGANIRFNSLTVDGVKQNDDFGLNKNGYPSRRSPISLDAIEQLSVNIAPFDVSYGSFQGGNINVVTKSGTNDLSGSLFYYKSNDSLIGDKSDGLDINVGEFEEDTYGFSLGGALVEDKLFFFTSYEKYETTSPYGKELNNGDGNLTLTEIPGVTEDEFARIDQIANDVYGYDTLGFDADNKMEDEKLLVKFDWYINDNHRSSFTYQRSTGDTVRDFWPSLGQNNVASVSNRYRHADELSVYSLQFFSDWNDDFSTEVKVGLKQVTTTQVALGDDFAQLRITTPSGGDVYIGPDQFRHANELENDRFNFSIKGNYYLDDEHTLSFGYEREILDIYNLFVFGSKGWAEYVSIDAFEAMDPLLALYQNAPTNNPEDAADDFEYHTDVLYIQDEWAVNDDLTVTAGLRYTKYTNDDLPELNTNFVDRHGYANTENFDGLDLLSPRVGFNYLISDETTIRGGIGLFGGGAPNVWLSNSYGNDGVRKHVTFGLAENYGGWVDLEGFDGRNIPQYYLDNLAPVDADTNSIDPDFEIPSTWKYNLAVDHVADLSDVGLGEDWRLSAEYIYNKVNNAVVYRDLNLTQIDTAPDGRPIYDTATPFDLSLTNTSRGYSEVITLSAQKAFYTDHGMYDLRLDYTHQNSKEVNPGNAFIAFEGYAMPASSDFQSETLYNSEYEIPHAFSANLSWSGEVFGDNVTRVNLLFTARQGSHYSYTMATSGAFGGFGSDFADWNAFNSQLLYVPTGVDDPKVEFTNAEQAQAFDDFVSNNGCLSGQRGQIAKRHSCSSPWIQRLDLSVTQEIDITEDQKVELYLDVQNLGNLINSDWGRAEVYPPAYLVPVTNSTTIVDGVYNYDVNVTDGQLAVPQLSIVKVPSVWKAQVGIRYRF